MRARLAVLAAILGLGVAAPVRAAAPTGHDARVALGRAAFTYGFPLLEFLRVRATQTSVTCPDHIGDAPLGSFSNARVLADPRERTVVAPNVDTLYSIAQLDLGHGPIVLSHPNMGKRYFVFELLDPYTNVVGYIGSRTTGSKAGAFAITWTKGPHRSGVRGAKLVRSPSRRLWVIGRTLASTKADQRKAYALMRQYTLARAGARPKTRACTPARPRKAKPPAGAAFLAALGRALAANPPPKRDAPILRRLAAGGIGPGKAPTDPALAEGVEAARADLVTSSKLTLLKRALAGHGWLSLDRRVGAYGTDYDLRALVAQVGLGANTPAEATYPVALTDSAGKLFTGADRYRLTFRKGHAPPARGFWSVTMYDSGGYLVPNAAHRYAIGSSHPPLVRRKDGSIVVAIQRTRPADPTVNWLPSPPAGFRLNLRLYVPEPSVLSGAWAPPPVQNLGPG